MIYITGNTHGDINRFETEQTKKFTSEDYLIICGDFGFIWNGGKREEKQQPWRTDRGFVFPTDWRSGA